ncbi:unnamed protein product [Ixodes hexagonus]
MDLSRAGKYQCQLLATTSTHAWPVQRRPHLFFLPDKDTEIRFVVDTGAEVSALPPTAQDRCNWQSLQLREANGTVIRTYGARTLSVNIGSRRVFRWIFIIAATQYPILGADFLQHFNLLVDKKKIGLYAHEATINRLAPLLVSPDSPYIGIMQQFPCLVRPCTFTSQVKHNV